MKNIYWTDFHTNFHHKHMDEIDKWYNFAKDTIDFWSPCYYPYIIDHLDNGFHLEAEQPFDIYKNDFSKIKDYLAGKEESDGYIGFASFEWQGAGLDGDHNVFYRDFSQDIYMPRLYSDLKNLVKIGDTIAIPHHTGYSPGHRGKNWDTHCEELSPITEIYSSHGCSESDQTNIPLNVHIHMGPREDRGCAFTGLNEHKKKIGFMCSGDNHIIPAISGNGLMAVVCDEYDKDKIFDAMLNRHVYGVTRSKIKLDYQINGHIMGSEITSSNDMKASIKVKATNAIDRIEIIQNGIVANTYNHKGTYESEPISGRFRAKFEFELGWGPDVRIFDDITSKIWGVKLNTECEIIDVEKLFTSDGHEIIKSDSNNFVAKIRTSKEGVGNGKLSQKNYMTPFIQTQSIIFEVEGELGDVLNFEIDGKTYKYTLEETLKRTHLEAQYDEVKELVKNRFEVEDYYRSDPFWHNAYKFKVHKACPSRGYEVEVDYPIFKYEEVDNVMVKVYQVNGEVVWSSPIWID